MSKPLFSIALIAKDEAKTLPRLLSSLSEFKARNGEVVLLDTGSQDLTVKVATDWGCVVKEVGEKHLHTIDEDLARKVNEMFVVEDEMPIVKGGDKYFHFADSRNEAASLAKNDWICYADADESFTKLDIDKINEIISDANVHHLSYEFVFAHHPDGSPSIQFRQSKFYDRTKLHWVGAVHEVLQRIN